MEKTFGSAGGWLAGIASTTAAVILAACGGGGGGGGGPEMGTVSMSMIDATCDYRNVWVNVKEVRVQKSSTAGDTDTGWVTLTPVPTGTAKRVDLLHLTNGDVMNLGAATVEAGVYSQLRLVLEDTGNDLVLGDGTSVPLKTPSAQQSGLKIKTDFTVVPNTTTAYILDFDACKSIVVAGNSGQYILKPVVRLTPQFTGSIAGTVSTPGAAVSAQTATGAVERTTVADGTGKFVIPFVLPGTYSVVAAASGHRSAVVTSVPVGTTTTTISTSIPLGTSTMATVSGTVANATTVSGLIDASVTATQGLTGGPTITVKETNVDGNTGAYSLSLPTASPTRSTFATTTMTFTTDAAVGDAYKFVATTPGKSPLERIVHVLTDTIVNFTFP
jgi:hypothetical protein